jgi:hypothetical protein
MGWQDDSTPVLPTDAGAKSSTATDQPGFWSNQLGPLAPVFGLPKPKMSPPMTVGTILDIGRRAADQVPFVGNYLDEQGAQERLKGTAYEGAGEALGMAATAAGAEAVGAGRYIASKAGPLISKVIPNQRIADFLAGRVGGAAEQGTIAATGSAGHGGSASDDLKAGLIGAVTGAATGPGGSKTTPVTPPTSDLEQLNKTAWTKAENTPVNPQAVANQLGWTKQNLTPGERTVMSGGLGTAVNKAGREALNSKSMSADDVSKFQDALWNAARNDVGLWRSPADQMLASKFSGALDTALGPALPVVQEANKATGAMKTGKEIDNWLTNPSAAPKQIQGALAKDPDFYNHQPGLREQLTNIAAKAKPDPSVSQAVGSEIAKRLTGAAIGTGASYAFGGGLPGDLAGAAVGAAIPSAVSKFKTNQIRNSLLAAKHLNATGLKLDPSEFGSGTVQSGLDLLRQGAYGAGAAGKF